MPLGYVKGNSYCQNWDYDRYAAMPIFKLLCDYARKLKLSLHFTYSPITRAYDCEIRQICYFKQSALPYWLGLANRGGDTPVEALCNALRVAVPVTPLLEVLCLEAQCVLLAEDLERSRKLEEKMTKALLAVEDVVAALQLYLCNQAMAEVEEYECENCIGMIEHGCYCKAMGAPAPGEPAVEWIDITPTAEAVELVMNPPKVEFYRDGKPLPADPGEDDDL